MINACTPTGAAGRVAAVIFGEIASLLVLRGILAVTPIGVLDPFQKSAIGTLIGLGLLVALPFACSAIARRAGASPYARAVSLGAGVGVSVLLFFPVVILFME